MRTLYAFLILYTGGFCITGSGQSWLPVGTNDLNAGVWAMEIYNGELYAGGYFTKAGGLTVNGIARWNGVKWDSVGQGFSDGSSSAQVLAILAHNGVLYVGGAFDKCGGFKCHGIAKWDGNTWSSAGAGLSNGSSNGGVSALAIYNGFVIAAGGFNISGINALNNIARWDGNQWVALGQGINGEGSALEIYNNELYVAGWFTSAGGISANHIAKWDGNNWSAVGSGANDFIYGLSEHKGFLYAGGLFTSIGGISASRIAKWDGTSWSSAGSGATNGIRVLYNDSLSSSLYIGGTFSAIGGVSAKNIAMFDGNIYSAMGAGFAFSGEVLSIIKYKNDIYAGGDFTSSGTTAVNFIAKWDPGTGVKEEEESGKPEVTLYPNPTRGEVTVAVNTPGTYDIAFYNAAGAKAWEAQEIRGSINVSSKELPAGVYLYEVAAGENIYKGKVVVE